MQSLDPILVERYSKRFDQLIGLLDSAAMVLIPDAFEMQIQSIRSARDLVVEQKVVFDEILNSLSVGVLFQEGVEIKLSAEQAINRTCVGLLWSCLDIISDINLFRSDFADFMESISIDSPAAWNLKDFVLVESQVDNLCDALESASNLIISVISSFDN